MENHNKVICTFLQPYFFRLLTFICWYAINTAVKFPCVPDLAECASNISISLRKVHEKAFRKFSYIYLVFGQQVSNNYVFLKIGFYKYSICKVVALKVR